MQTDDLTERERQIVAWLREQAQKGKKHLRLAMNKADAQHQKPEIWAGGVEAIIRTADAIEAGEPWKGKDEDRRP